MRHTVLYEEKILCNQKYATFGVPKSRRKPVSATREAMFGFPGFALYDSGPLCHLRSARATAPRILFLV